MRKYLVVAVLDGETINTPVEIREYQVREFLSHLKDCGDKLGRGESLKDGELEKFVRGRKGRIESLRVYDVIEEKIYYNVIRFNAEDKFTISGRGTVYTGMSQTDDDYMNQKVIVTYKGEEIHGICTGVEGFGAHKSAMGKNMGLLLRVE